MAQAAALRPPERSRLRQVLRRHAGSPMRFSTGCPEWYRDPSKERSPRLGIFPVDARFPLEAGAEVAVEAVLACPDLGLLVIGGGEEAPAWYDSPYAESGPGDCFS